MGRIIVATLALAVLAAACGNDTAADGGDLQLGALSEGSAFEVGVGDKIVVQLEGNPSTGYSWSVTELEAAVLRQVGDFEFLTESEAIGGGGMLQLTFEAVAAGETVLRLGYLRPWETDVAPVEEWSVTVSVR
jgi:inhibitor of cysteine peptidase